MLNISCVGDASLEISPKYSEQLFFKQLFLKENLLMDIPYFINTFGVLLM